LSDFGDAVRKKRHDRALNAYAEAVDKQTGERPVENAVNHLAVTSA
jgi:hypothetical protein